MVLSDYIIQENQSIIRALELLDIASSGILFVCADDGTLKGCLTDGDVRRYILKNGDLQAGVMNATNLTPMFYFEKEFEEKADYKHYRCIPILNKKMQIVSLRFADETLRTKKHLELPVVIMAGGKGTRLYPYTQVLPKPLIPIGDETITEHIMNKFESFGCSKFHMIVNYKRNLIKAYFQDHESQHDVEFHDEYEYLGTGGGLKLLQGRVETTFFMSNCDTLIDVNYEDILKLHQERGAMLTMICAAKKVVIPYGTVEISDYGYVCGLKEKPRFTFLTNVGLYLIEPEFLQKIPEKTFIHITDVIQTCIDEGEKIGIFPIDENAWMDMGQMEELEQMRARLEDVTK